MIAEVTYLPRRPTPSPLLDLHLDLLDFALRLKKSASVLSPASQAVTAATVTSKIAS
jgi:hypothetical protein